MTELLSLFVTLALAEDTARLVVLDELDDPVAWLLLVRLADGSQLN